MGISLSRKPSASEPLREIKWVPDREVAPLTTLAQLLEYNEQPLLCVVDPLSNAIRRGEPGQPRTIFCHDMDGNYNEDRFIHGSDKADAYRFHHWQIIETFIYYSRYMVTIPPPGWISVAHRHGVKVLGTFILGEDDTKTINMIRGSGLMQQVVAQLVKVTTTGRFDGWLISIGCNMDPSCVAFVKDFLKSITDEVHKAIPGSLVIWYDALDVDGKTKPHNELDGKNACFFDLCDGIFLNFRWTEAMLRNSAQLAGDRKADVYAGVDVYARHTSYTGGYTTCKAVQYARRCGLSAAVFGAGWVYKTQGKKNFVKNQCRLWSFPDDCCSQWRLTKLPLTTSFCQGFGNKVFEDGQVIARRPWFNLHKQQLQPRDQGYALCGTCCSMRVHTDDAFNGGGCLRILFKPNRHLRDVKPYVRLFGCDFPLGPLEVSYTFKNTSKCTSVGQDIAIVLKARNAAGEAEEIHLGVVTSFPEGDNYVVTRGVTERPEEATNEPTSSWATRKYHLEDQRGADGAVLQEIGVRLACVNQEALVCLLGQLDIRRPGDTAEAASSGKAVEQDVQSDDSSGDDEPERKRQRDELYGLEPVE
ncbi:hypothetical protein HPB50_017154 [Hyalomma asiaticum]|uniref:Uncharacterized protein n=1 Tax=Hyalomma asiaticum TaxID=266040 RepID=A0ACB7TA66_HYAAI|nr:hypothetical protein HPB50_017154 [Hyalomma asiaticum]